MSASCMTYIILKWLKGLFLCYMKIVNKQIITITFLFFLAQLLRAQQGNGLGPHGGMMKSIGDYKMEVLGCDDYLEVYLYDRDTNAVNNSKIVGNVEFYYNESAALVSSLVKYGIDGFTAKIPVN